MAGITFASDDDVHSTATSGLDDFSARTASADTFTRSRRPSPTTSPRSRPALPGSMSTAPTIWKPLRDAIC